MYVTAYKCQKEEWLGKQMKNQDFQLNVAVSRLEKPCAT
jgi:hypothetical protein